MPEPLRAGRTRSVPCRGESRLMFKAICSPLMFVALVGAFAVSQQTVSAGRFDGCCRVCRQPQCCCTAPAPQACQVPQQRDVVTTEYRNEAITETVPSTIYENVMVDEGGYQTVWVPRLTTRSVARTIYQARTSYRTVPYQVTRRINDFGIQAAPAQTVRLAPTTSGSTLSALPSSSYIVPPLAIPSAPTSIASGTPVPVPDPRFAGSATPISPRNAATLDAGKMSSSLQSADRGPSLFAPAPSAAQVWRTPRGSVTR